MIDIGKYQHIIRGVVIRMAGPTSCAADLEDIIQSVNLRLLEGSIASYDQSRGTVEAFIAVMARSMTIDAWRRKKRAPIAASDEMDARENGGFDEGSEYRSSYLSSEDIMDHSEDALTMLVREQQRERLEAVIKKLSKDDQHFLLVSMQPDYDNRAYAERLGVTEVALRVRKYRLAERLRSLLAEVQS